ncbi:MAG: ATP-binding protein [Gemmatimonadota bacterium]|nr:ATP-binding protein [Gemmatimonadota bacterium]
MPRPNPFQIHGLARGPFFTDRAAELRAATHALRTPGEKLLVIGPRRTGKSSLLAEAADRARRAGVAVLEADLSTAGTVADVGTRLLDAAVRTLGRRWKDAVSTLAARVTPGVRLVPGPHGLPAASLDVSLRDAPAADQQRSLETVLDTIADLARAKKRPVAIVMDEFQRIGTVGGEEAEWHLRGVVQRHDAVSYLFAGSELGLIARMTGPGGAFYELLTPLEVGAIEPAHFAAWIDDRMRAVGLRPERGVAEQVLALTGDRTRDVVLLAHHTVEAARATGTRVTAAQVEAAFAAVVAEQDPQWTGRWSELTAGMQQVLRAVAVGAAGLTTAAMRREFGLGPTGTVTNMAAALVARDVLVRDAAAPTGYRFDSPYFRGWVLGRALPDLGRHVPVTATTS